MDKLVWDAFLDYADAAQSLDEWDRNTAQNKRKKNENKKRRKNKKKGTVMLP